MKLDDYKRLKDNISKEEQEMLKKTFDCDDYYYIKHYIALRYDFGYIDWNFFYINLDDYYIYIHTRQVFLHPDIMIRKQNTFAKIEDYEYVHDKVMDCIYKKLIKFHELEKFKEDIENIVHDFIPLLKKLESFGYDGYNIDIDNFMMENNKKIISKNLSPNIIIEIGDLWDGESSNFYLLFQDEIPDDIQKEHYLTKLKKGLSYVEKQLNGEIKKQVKGLVN